jgi:lysophospholipase L1-like esterase
MIRRAAVLAVAGVLSLSACSDDGAGPGSGQPPASVWVLGDSITVLSDTAIRTELAAAGVVAQGIDAESGRRIAVGDDTPLNGIAAMQRLIDQGITADTWVIALGTNDAGQYASGEEEQAVMAQLLALIPAESEVVWVDTCLPGREDQTDRINDSIAAVLDDREGASIAKWSDVCTDEGVLVADLVHPTPAGQQLFAELILDAIS